jgi:putative membrane protein
MPAPHQLNQADRTFLHEAAIGGMGEVDLAKLAEQKAQSDGVKRFAQRMIQDHTKANDRLAALAKAASAPLPSILDEDHRAMRAALAKTSGAAFDRAYLQGQIADHQKTAQLLEYEIGSGQDMQLKSYAAEILPTVLDHLQTAQALFAEAGNVPPQAAAPATPATQSGSTAPSRN